MTRVGIIIVNYRTAELVADCLRALALEVAALPGCRVVVVDGGSGDGSAEQLADAIRREGWGDWVELLALVENRGFGAGNNAALHALLGAADPPEYLLLLNPDTVVRPGAVSALVAFLDAHPRVGIAGSRLEDPDGTPQRSAFRFPSVASEFEAGLRLGLVSRLLRHRLVAPPVREEDHATDWVSGASLMVRRTVLESIGLFDEGFFLYYEETDLCYRATRAGWTCWYVPSSRVVHLGGQSTGMKEAGRSAKRVPRFWFDSRRRFFTKVYGSWYRVACDAAWAVGFALWRVRRRIQRKPDQDPPGMLRDFIAFSFSRTAPTLGTNGRTQPVSLPNP
jgi:GT2 family glycosyltransferase